MREVRSLSGGMAASVVAKSFVAMTHLTVSKVDALIVDARLFEFVRIRDSIRTPKLY
jgi:hypothetical protein